MTRLLIIEDLSYGGSVEFETEVGNVDRDEFVAWYEHEVDDVYIDDIGDLEYLLSAGGEQNFGDRYFAYTEDSEK